jgi:metal-responsive CopG/Arc/MetJ family transcriptional regulator
MELRESNGTRKVEIPSTLYDEIERRIKGTNFRGVSDFVASMLREFLNRHTSNEIGSSTGLSQEDEEGIKKKLQALGYL